MTKGNITLTMIKPVAVKEHHAGDILSQIEHAGFHIIALKMTQLPKEKAEIFYDVHKDKPFFGELINFMSSGPVVAALLEKENAVEDFRKLIGSTDPKEADEGTIRKKYAKDKTHNAIHGSDSDENALRESRFFFSEMEQFR
ncbi:MAG: nucleoside-diphosphate kinase [Anaerophaga sp.]|uniref:nucleoside-diphosphate kinase n=1 Tax=Anaerophaga thermohalophila TaxID=177400 RepID=UPI000237BAA7|nr:nucleoside-diphosphate kinase [Anaerophaga thermohalophila]MDK2840687.1 nucleoside-diphosphate kinase [Anaerophaga sp.]